MTDPINKANAAQQDEGNHGWLLRHLRHGLKLYILVVILVAVVSILSLVDPLIVKWLVDAVLPSKRIDLLIWAMLSILAIYLVRLSLHSLAAAMTAYASQMLAYRVRLKLLRRTLSLSAAFLGKTDVGDLIQRIDKDVEQICQVGSSVASTLLRMILSLITVVGTMLYLNWRLTCILLPFFPAFLVLRQHYRERLESVSAKVRKHVGLQGILLHEILTGAVQIQLLGCQRKVIRSYGLASQESVRSEIQRQKQEFTFDLNASLVIAFGIAVIFGFGGWEVFHGTLTVGGLIAFYTYFTRLFDPLANAVEATTKLQRMGPHIRQVRELERDEHLLARPVRAFGGRTLSTASVPRRFSMEHVHFAYRDGLPVLKGIDLQFHIGEMVAIVGANGSGKSTLFKLLTRMYDVNLGRIRVDGCDIRSISVRRLRSMIAVVLQQPIIFSMSLRENILLGNPKATTTELNRVVRLSALESVVNRIPRGLDERIGLGGFGLSGGECQRVSIARALLENKPILLLDEATSGLDPDSERELIAALTTELREHLIVVITHRPEAARMADRVVVLDEGTIRDIGPHAALCQKSPYYGRLWRELDNEDQVEANDEEQLIQCTPR